MAIQKALIGCALAFCVATPDNGALTL